MNKFLTILFLILCLSFDSQAETDYKDFIVTDKFIWALTSNGEIKLFDKKGKQVEKRIHNSSEILLLTKDKLGNPVPVSGFRSRFPAFCRFILDSSLHSK